MILNCFGVIVARDASISSALPFSFEFGTVCFAILRCERGSAVTLLEHGGIHVGIPADPADTVLIRRPQVPAW
ncbi:hypothetical protein [Streptomyces californicus]|uniref:hypothetical protein n=1 Tax=Streptomyces californicus TaxID=67351 RepID=UPI0037876615